MFAPHLSHYAPFLEGIDEMYPPQLVGLGAALIGMFVGSLGPQWIKNECNLSSEAE